VLGTLPGVKGLVAALQVVDRHVAHPGVDLLHQRVVVALDCEDAVKCHQPVDAAVQDGDRLAQGLQQVGRASARLPLADHAGPCAHRAGLALGGGQHAALVAG